MLSQKAWMDANEKFVLGGRLRPHSIGKDLLPSRLVSVRSALFAGCQPCPCVLRCFHLHSKRKVPTTDAFSRPQMRMSAWRPLSTGRAPSHILIPNCQANTMKTTNGIQRRSHRISTRRAPLSPSITPRKMPLHREPSLDSLKCNNGRKQSKSLPRH